MFPPWKHLLMVILYMLTLSFSVIKLNQTVTFIMYELYPLSAQFLARDVIYTSRAYAMMPVRLSVTEVH